MPEIRARRFVSHQLPAPWYSMRYTTTPETDTTMWYFWGAAYHSNASRHSFTYMSLGHLPYG